MNPISPLVCVGILMICFSYAQGTQVQGSEAEKQMFYLPKGGTGMMVFMALDLADGMTFEYPGRPHLKSSDRILTREHPASPHAALMQIRDVEMRDTGIIRCSSSKGMMEIELVVYEESDIRDLKVEAVSDDQISVSWKAPLKSPELVMRHIVIVFEMPGGKVKTSKEVRPPSESGTEIHLLDGVAPGDYKIVVSTYYAYENKQSTHRGPMSTYNITSALWAEPELSIQALALAPDTVLVTLKIEDSESLTELQTSYSDDGGETWTDIEVDENERFAVVNDLQPQTTYRFKSKGGSRFGPKEVATHVVTPRSAVPPPSTVTVGSVTDTGFTVTWQQENSDGVKGYTVTVEELQADQSYRINTEKTTPVKELQINGISQDVQYRVTVRAYDLNGLGQPSEAAMYPEIPEATTASPVECPTTASPVECPTTASPIECPKCPTTASPVECPTTAAALEPDTTEESDQSYSLDVRVVKQTSSRLRVMWFLPRGDLNAVDRFQIMLTSKTGKKLLDSKLRKNQRSISLHPMSAETSYTVIVKALDSEGNVLVAKQVPVTPESTGGGFSEAELLLEASEIRDKQARLSWALKNVDPPKLQNIRMRVYKGGPDGPQVLKRTISSATRTILLSKLPTDSVFHIVMEAIAQDDQAFLRSDVTLKTPSPGEIGEPVTGASRPVS